MNERVHKKVIWNSTWRWEAEHIKTYNSWQSQTETMRQIGQINHRTVRLSVNRAERQEPLWEAALWKAAPGVDIQRQDGSQVIQTLIDDWSYTDTTSVNKLLKQILQIAQLNKLIYNRCQLSYRLALNWKNDWLYILFLKGNLGDQYMLAEIYSSDISIWFWWNDNECIFFLFHPIHNLLVFKLD